MNNNKPQWHHRVFFKQSVKLTNGTLMPSVHGPKIEYHSDYVNILGSDYLDGPHYRIPNDNIALIEIEPFNGGQKNE